MDDDTQRCSDTLTIKGNTCDEPLDAHMTQAEQAARSEASTPIQAEVQAAARRQRSADVRESMDKSRAEEEHVSQRATMYPDPICSYTLFELMRLRLYDERQQCQARVPDPNGGSDRICTAELSKHSQQMPLTPLQKQHQERLQKQAATVSSPPPAAPTSPSGSVDYTARINANLSDLPPEKRARWWQIWGGGEAQRIRRLQQQQRRTALSPTVASRSASCGPASVTALIGRRGLAPAQVAFALSASSSGMSALSPEATRVTLPATRAGSAAATTAAAPPATAAARERGSQQTFVTAAASPAPPPSAASHCSDAQRQVH